MDPATMSPTDRANGGIQFNAPAANFGRHFLFPTTCVHALTIGFPTRMAGRANLLIREWPISMIELLWLAGAFLVPLSFFPWAANPFELPKALVLRALVLLMALTILIRLIDGKPSLSNFSAHRPSAWLALPAIALVLAEIAATALSVNPLVSLWGSYERQQGLVTLGEYILLFLFISANLHCRDQVNRLISAIVWGSAPVVIYGIIQALGLDPIDWRTDAASPVLSTLGRSNFFGSYLTLVIPLTIGQFAYSRRPPTLLLLLCQSVCLALTQARGAWIGLFVGITAFVLALTLSGGRIKRVILAFAIVLLVSGSVVFASLLGDPAPSMPGLARLAKVTHLNEGSAAARLTIWRATNPLIAARPWLGYGPETMRVVFDSVFPPQLVYYQGRNVPVDRAHNVLLDTAMSTGLIGLAAWLALLVGFFYLSLKALRSTSDRWELIVWTSLLSSIAGHLVDLQFSFDLTAGATIFWMILALAAALPSTRSPVPSYRSTVLRDRFARLASILPTLLILLLIGMLGLRPLAADNAFWNSQQATQSLRVRQTEAERAVLSWPVAPEYRLRLAEIDMLLGNSDGAVKQMEIADQLSPNDPQLKSAIGSLYAYWGDREPLRYVQAETAFRRAVELAPNIAASHTLLGLVLVRQGRQVDALAELERAVDLDATDGVAFHHLADSYWSLGRTSDAARARRESRRWSGEPWTESEIPFAINMNIASRER